MRSNVGSAKETFILNHYQGFVKGITRTLNRVYLE